MTGHHFKRFPSQKVFRQVKITNRKINQHCTSTGLPPPSNPQDKLSPTCPYLAAVCRRHRSPSRACRRSRCLNKCSYNIFFQNWLLVKIAKYTMKRKTFNKLIKIYLVAVTSHSTQPRWPCWAGKGCFRRWYRQLKQSYITSSASA